MAAYMEILRKQAPVESYAFPRGSATARHPCKTASPFLLEVRAQRASKEVRLGRWPFHPSRLARRCKRTARLAPQDDGESVAPSDLRYHAISLWPRQGSCLFPPRSTPPAAAG